jgi:RNA-binding protein
MSNITLNGYQKKHLKGLAHRRKPIVFIGQNGLTDAVVSSTLQALRKHELIKIKFIEHKKKEQKKNIIGALCEQTHSDIVGMIGHVAIIFKLHPDPDKRLISLPEKTLLD